MQYTVDTSHQPTHFARKLPVAAQPEALISNLGQCHGTSGCLSQAVQATVATNGPL
jgi:hypothetical protein